MPGFRSLIRSVVMTAIVAFILSMNGCSDQPVNVACTTDCIILRGRFTTAGGDVPLANHHIGLNWQPTGSTTGGHKVLESTTDDGGYYYMSFTATDEELQQGYYNITYALENGIYSPDGAAEGSFAVDNFVRNETYEKYFQVLRRGGHLTIKIKNPSDIPGGALVYTAFVEYGYVNQGEPTQVFGLTDSHDVAVRDPEHPYADNRFETAADQRTYISVTRNKPDGTTQGVDFVYVEEGEEGVFEIEF